MGQEERELAFQRTRKVLTGSSCGGKRLEVHASHILFVWRLQWPALSIQPPICSLFLYSFHLFFVSSTLFSRRRPTCTARQGYFLRRIDLFRNNLRQARLGRKFTVARGINNVERGSRLLLMGCGDRAQCVPGARACLPPLKEIPAPA